LAQFLRFRDVPGSEPAFLAHPVPHPDLRCLADQCIRLGSDLSLEDAASLQRALPSYARWWHDEFSGSHEHCHLLGQDNHRRYLPFESIRIRLSAHDSAFEILARLAAARVTGARLIVSHPPIADPAALSLIARVTKAWKPLPDVVEESDDAVAESLRQSPAHTTERLRFAAPDRVPPAVRAAAAAAGVHLADDPVVAHGRVELLRYLREQSVCTDYHRYGNLGTRASESRREPT